MSTPSSTLCSLACGSPRPQRPELQLNRIELREYIQEVLDQNPILEREGAGESEAPEADRAEFADGYAKVLEFVRPVRLQLDRNAAELASAGSEFWIVQPEIGFSGIRGLDTLFTGVRLRDARSRDPHQARSPDRARCGGVC